MPLSVSGDTRSDTLGPGAGAAATDWDNFRVFLTVARVGNFRRAAAELRTTQATVSRRVESLERALDAKLFDRPRGRGGVTLTFDGRRVLQDVSAAELCFGRAGRGRGEGGVQGECKILGSDGIANFWMPPFLHAFGLRYPEVQLKYFLAADTTSGQRPPFDLQMQYLAATEADSVSHLLATVHFTFFASRDYLASRGHPKEIGALAHHSMLKFSSYLADEHSWSEYWVDAASQKGAVYSNSSALLGELVLAGAGIAMLPTYLAALNPKFVPILSDHHLKAGIFLNFQRDTAKKAAVRTTIDFLKDVAFDRRAMPWFGDSFEEPVPEWQAVYRAHLAAANPIVPARLVG